MKKNIFIFFIIFGQAMLAQKFNGFYFEPIINVKTTTFYNVDFQPPLITPYFTLKTQHPITPLGFAVGLNIGYKFKNNNIIQLGIFQDESLSGVDFSGNIILNGTTFVSNDGIKASHYGGVSTTNINGLFKKELFKIVLNKKITEPYISIYFNIGLTYFYKPNNGLENLTGINELQFYSIDSTLVKYSESVWVVPQRPINSFKLNTGIEVTFGNKKHELFNISLSYITNIQKTSYFSFTSAGVRLIDKFGKETSYTYYVKARGNGMYYQISKRFYPFKWYNTRQQRKIEEFKRNTN
jgi:hypothetical protein